MVQSNANRSGPGMPHHVGQRLLHDPVGGHPDVRGRCERRLDGTCGRRDGERGIEAGGPDPLDEDGKLVQTRLVEWVVGGFAQAADRAAELDDSVPAGGGDRGERGIGAIRLVSDQQRTRLRLDDHDAYRVGEDVVQIAGDPGAFAQHRRRTFTGDATIAFG